MAQFLSGRRFLSLCRVREGLLQNQKEMLPRRFYILGWPFLGCLWLPSLIFYNCAVEETLLVAKEKRKIQNMKRCGAYSD